MSRCMHGRPSRACSQGFGRIRPDKTPAQLGYVLTTEDNGTKLAVHVLAFSNTVSWQFRYEPVPGAYTPLTAQRVMDSLADRMRFMQDLQR